MQLSFIASLIRREVTGRYRGSILGILWSLLTPLFLLGVYTFVFGTIFKTRWSGSADNASTTEFAIILFCGLIAFQFFSDVINRAPTIILSNQNYVKKVIFPLEVLVPVAVGSALFHAFVSTLVLLVIMGIVTGPPPFTLLWLPVIYIPFCLLIMGLSWFLASLGVFIRDINQILGTIITALLFLAPIFFPLTALPEIVKKWIYLNPIVVPVEQVRKVMIFGEMPDFKILGIYTLVSIAVAVFGYWWFQKTRKGFADVL